MRTKFTLSAATLLILSSVACKKDGDKGRLDGNWAFTSVQTQGTSTAEYNDGSDEKTITTSDYTSTDTKGTVSISGGTMNSKGISYTINTELSYVTFSDDVQTDSGTEPFSFSVPASNSTATFKLIGTDSIAFPNGGISSLGGAQTGAYGSKYTLVDNKLTMTMHLDTTFIDQSYGFPIQKHDVATQTTILTRQ